VAGDLKKSCNFCLFLLSVQISQHGGCMKCEVFWVWFGWFGWFGWRN